MKKYVVLIALFIIALAVIFFTGNYTNNKALKVNTITVQPVSVNDTVTCSGTIVESNTQYETDYSNYISVYNTLIDSEKSRHDEEAGVATGDMYVILEASQTQAISLSVGQSVLISGAGLGEEEYTGTITSVDDKAKQKISISNSKTVVDAVVNVNFEGNPNIRSGYTVKGVVNTGVENNILIVPYETVKADEDGSEYVMKAVNGIAQKNYVVTGQDRENGLEIISGISANDVIILDDTVTDGQKVDVNA